MCVFKFWNSQKKDFFFQENTQENWEHNFETTIYYSGNMFKFWGIVILKKRIFLFKRITRIHKKTEKDNLLFWKYIYICKFWDFQKKGFLFCFQENTRENWEHNFKTIIYYSGNMFKFLDSQKKNFSFQKNTQENTISRWQFIILKICV